VYTCRLTTIKKRAFIKNLHSSGVAGPLAAQGGGQICRPFVLGFETGEEVRTGRSQGPNVIADDRYTLAVTLCFSCTQTYETYNLNFHVDFF